MANKSLMLIVSCFLQPTDDHHITSKDLYDLLEKHHNMREELERTRESNRRQAFANFFRLVL